MRAVLILLAVLLTSCGGPSESPISEAPRSSIITCTASYRPSVTEAIEGTEILTFADEDAQQSLAFADLEFHAAYSAGRADNERALRVWVSEVGQATPYQTQLYQLELESGPQNQFRGGHGFTGLSYSYHPISQAELQFWCESE
jgi:hypothetical protein